LIFPREQKMPTSVIDARRTPDAEHSCQELVRQFDSVGSGRVHCLEKTSAKTGFDRMNGVASRRKARLTFDREQRPRIAFFVRRES
jgi:hypothetical protein